MSRISNLKPTAMTASNTNIVTSPYRRGADDGFMFGLYLTLMFFSGIFGFGLLSFLMMVCVPTVIYFFMRRYDRQLQECATFPMMWMQGVVIFVCGMLIAGTFLVVYMKWIQPDFILNQLEAVIEVGAQNPGTALEEVGEVAEQMIKANFIPSAMSIVSELIMLAIVTGSILSIIISSIFALRHKTARQRRDISRQ
ncbi:MAG: DUF4199 domain-containing protein [Bacteroides sp.]|nr:DUF4199 domain-containing protein [Bacteroides sp.]